MRRVTWLKPEAARRFSRAALALSLAVTPGGCIGAFADDDADADTDGMDGTEPGPCGPTTATVSWVVDGDTISIEESNANVRFILVGAPEIEHQDRSGDVTPAECFGDEAHARAIELLRPGTVVQLTYDVECRDRYDRLLAYVEVDGVDVNRTLIDEGFACVFQVPPNGADRIDDYRSARDAAIAANRGLWAVCPEVCQ